MGLQTATLGGGCFWCLHAAFSEITGIVDVVSGYAGGHIKNPSYELVCTGSTGFAEVVQVKFDPDMLSYTELLALFFALHDPTTLNRQGADVGTQYRSVIFYHNEEQKKLAEQKMAELTSEKVYSNSIVTELAPLEVFYAAEDYHQDYFERNPTQPYCQVVISPKLTKLRKQFASRLKAASDRQS
ncbi:MAG: peptide-methionine (S)-S-oxide reductase MsrA [Anaerolineales bacterium]|nr:peptide-methionine (S)-S-oxide reductase MsrA [Anaerolineales bacterium]